MLVGIIAENYMKNAKELLKEIDKYESVIEVNEKELEDKKQIFKKTIQNMIESKEDLLKKNDEIKYITTLATQVELNENTIFKLIKGQNSIHEKWIGLESKKAAIEGCIIQIKKSFEDGVIILEAFLETMRKLYAKIFKVIFKKKALEIKFKSKQGFH